MSRISRHFQYIAVKHASAPGYKTWVNMNHKIYDAGDIFDAGEQYVPTEAEENEGSSAIKTPAIRLGWNIRRMIHI